MSFPGNQDVWLFKVRDTVADRYRFRFRYDPLLEKKNPEREGQYDKNGGWCRSFLPARPYRDVVGEVSSLQEPYKSKPRTVVMGEPVVLWKCYGLEMLHELAHLALWHSQVGVWAATEADCVVLEHAWVRSIASKRAARAFLRFLPTRKTKIPYVAGTVGHRPRRMGWWKHELCKLKRLGVLDEDGEPTYQRADWRKLGDWALPT